MYYEIFTTYTEQWQYIYTLPSIFENNAFDKYRITKITKWNWRVDCEIIRQFDWDIIKLHDTPKRRFKIKLYVQKWK